MAYSARAVANAFIKRAKEGYLQKLTPMKLQKLIFFAHSWYMNFYNKPLVINDYFARWPTGPVIPSLFYELKEYGTKEINTYCGYIVEEEEQEIRKYPIIRKNDEEAWDIVDQIIEVYGKFSGTKLANLSVKDGSAWDKSGEADGGIISNEDMKKYINQDGENDSSDS